MKILLILARIMQKQLSRGVLQKAVLRNFTKFTGNTCVRKPKACNFIKKETLAKVFPCDFYRTPLNDYFWWCRFRITWQGNWPKLYILSILLQSRHLFPCSLEVRLRCSISSELFRKRRCRRRNLWSIGTLCFERYAVIPGTLPQSSSLMKF